MFDGVYQRAIDNYYIAQNRSSSSNQLQSSQFGSNNYNSYFNSQYASNNIYNNQYSSNSYSNSTIDQYNARSSQRANSVFYGQNSYNNTAMSQYNSYSSQQANSVFGLQNSFNTQQFRTSVALINTDLSMTQSNSVFSPLEPNDDKLADSNTLINSIAYSDLNQDGNVTLEEITDMKDKHDLQIQLLDIMKELNPANAAQIDLQIDQFQSQMDTLGLISENFAAFSGQEDADVIDAYDLVNLYGNANSDENRLDFTQRDLDKLKGVETPAVQITDNNDATAQEAYNEILGRDGDQDAITHWSGKMDEGYTEQDLAKDFFNSCEYINQDQTNAETVAKLYEFVLDRESEEGGQNYWTSELDAGKSVSTLVEHFYNSSEYKKHNQ